MFLVTGSFEAGTLGAWRAVNQASAVTVTVVTDPAQAKAGAHFMRFQTTQLGGSMAQDVRPPIFVRSVSVAGGTAYPTYAPVATSLLFSVWLKSAPGQANVEGTVVIWDLDPNIPAETGFNAGSQWVQFLVGLDKAATNVRAEIYLNTVNQWLDVDAASLV